MKKWSFWAVMTMAALANGCIFCLASWQVMDRGVPEADNQAALLFIPVLWLGACVVLAILNLCTLTLGRYMKKDQVIRPWELFRLSGLAIWERAKRLLYLSLTGVLMCFAWLLFMPELFWSASYALTGGLLLVLLFAWGTGEIERGRPL